MYRNSYTGASFSLTNRAARVVWQLVWVLFFRLSPAPLHGWRAFLLRLFGATIGKGSHIYPAVKIWAPWQVTIGKGTGIANGVNLYSQGKITIGDRTTVSQGSHLCTGTHDYTLPEHPLFTAPIFIGNHVWIAAEVFVHPGVNIADGCVVGARSVVVGDLPAYTVCTGHPCRVIKPRQMKAPL